MLSLVRVRILPMVFSSVHWDQLVSPSIRTGSIVGALLEVGTLLEQYYVHFPLTPVRTRFTFPISNQEVLVAV